MNAFEAGFYKEATDRGLNEKQAFEMLKVSMAFSGATPLFNHQNLDGQADPHQLQLAAAMQQQVAAEQQMHQMHQQMMQSQQMAQAPMGVAQ